MCHLWDDPFDRLVVAETPATNLVSKKLMNWLSITVMYPSMQPGIPMTVQRTKITTKMTIDHHPEESKMGIPGHLLNGQIGLGPLASQ